MLGYCWIVAKNIAKLLLGRRLTYPPLGSMTLDSDDVQLANQWLGRKGAGCQRESIDRFHSAFAAWNGSAHAYSFIGGRVALSAAIYALQLKPGDEVILPGYTCFVVPNSFRFAGVDVVYSDIELETFGLNSALLEAKITPRTKAILLHHLYGLVSRDYEATIRIARSHGLFVIEDCAHSTGAEFRGAKVGNRGDVAIYSSQQSKIFNTIQGGLVTTNDPGLAIRWPVSNPILSERDRRWPTLAGMACSV